MTDPILPPDSTRRSVRAVATDLDRTILPSSLEFSPDAGRRRSADATAVGDHAIIATGRMFASARPYALQLGDHRADDLLPGRPGRRSGHGRVLLHRPLDVAIARG